MTVDQLPDYLKQHQLEIGRLANSPRNTVLASGVRCRESAAKRSSSSSDFSWYRFVKSARVIAAKY